MATRRDEWRFIMRRRQREQSLATGLSRRVTGVLREVGRERARIAVPLLARFFRKQETPTDGELDELSDELVGMAGWLRARDAAVPKLVNLGTQWYGNVTGDLPGQAVVLGLQLRVPDRVSEFVLEEGGRRLGLIDLDKGVRDRVFRILVRAREEQMGIPQITRILRTEVPSGRFRTPQVRARVIARSEIKHAQRVSASEMYKTVPEIQSVRVFDAVLGDTDEDCEARNGQVVTMEGFDAMITSPVTHPNCTLDCAPIVN